LAVAAALAVPVAAHAEAGDWLFRAGLSQVNPKSQNLDVSNLQEAANSYLVVDSDISPTFNVTYMITDHIGTELLAAWPFTHGIDLKNSGSVVSRVGHVDVLPPTLSLQWHFNPNGAFRPYIGAGLNYTLFSGETARGALSGAKFQLEDSWGVAGDVGVDIGVSRNWFVNLDVRYIDMSSTLKVTSYDPEIEGLVHRRPWQGPDRPVGLRRARGLPLGQAGAAAGRSAAPAAPAAAASAAAREVR
jgi:outer membrane protein